MNEGTISFKIDDLSFIETEKIRLMLHNIIQSGALNMRNGKVILSFDDEGLVQISYDYIRWKKNKPMNLQTIYKSDIIKVT